MKGKTKTEESSKQAVEKLMGQDLKDTAAAVRIAKKAVFDRLPKDAASLHAWLDQARAVLDVQK